MNTLKKKIQRFYKEYYNTCDIEIIHFSNTAGTPYLKLIATNGDLEIVREIILCDMNI